MGLGSCFSVFFPSLKKREESTEKNGKESFTKNTNSKLNSNSI